VSKVMVARAATACALFVAPAAHAASDADVAQLRDEIRQMKEAYEARIRALEVRVQDGDAAASRAATPRNALPAAAATAPPSPSPLPAIAPAAAQAEPVQGAAAGGANAFNPAVSVVLEGVYSNLSQDPTRYGLHGFGLGDDVSPGRRGLGLG